MSALRTARRAKELLAQGLAERSVAKSLHMTRPTLRKHVAMLGLPAQLIEATDKGVIREAVLLRCVGLDDRQIRYVAKVFEKEGRLLHRHVQEAIRRDGPPTTKFRAMARRLAKQGVDVQKIVKEVIADVRHG